MENTNTDLFTTPTLPTPTTAWEKVKNFCPQRNNAVFATTSPVCNIQTTDNKLCPWNS